MLLLGTSLKSWVMVCHIYSLFYLKHIGRNEDNDDIEQSHWDMQGKQEITPFMDNWQ